MILRYLGFSIDTIGEFRGYFRELVAGELVFPGTALDGFSLSDPEKVLPDGMVLTPSEFFLEFRTDDILSRQVFLFASTLELMAFYQVLRNKRPMLMPAFVAVGSRPGIELVQKIMTRYKGARFVLVNGHTFFDRVWDVRLACHLDNFEPVIRMENGKVLIRAGKYEGQTFPDLLTLSRFSRLSGYRTSVRTMKAKGFNSYVEMIRQVPAFNP
ncbi:MAG: hypothetical protein AAGU19_01115 [Prolixibacteraceae bacterium]